MQVLQEDLGALTVKIFFLQIDTEGDKTRDASNLFQQLAART